MNKNIFLGVSGFSLTTALHHVSQIASAMVAIVTVTIQILNYIKNRKK